MRGCEQPENFHPEGDVYTHTRIGVAMLPRDAPRPSRSESCCTISPSRRCRAVVGDKMTFYGHTDDGAVMAANMLARLKRSRAVQERVAYLVKNHLKLCMAPRMRPSTLKRMLAEDGFDELMEVAFMDAMASSSYLGFYHFCRRAMTHDDRGRDSSAALIGGDDLIALGFTPGPALQRYPEGSRRPSARRRARNPRSRARIRARALRCKRRIACLPRQRHNQALRPHARARRRRFRGAPRRDSRAARRKRRRQDHADECFGRLARARRRRSRCSTMRRCSPARPRAALRAGIAAVHQSPMLFERMTWEENLALGGFDQAAASGSISHAVAARARDLAQHLGFELPPRRHHRRKSLGRRARPARSFARAELQSARADSRRADRRARADRS